MKKYRLGLIGVGNWAQNYIKTFHKFPEIELVAACRTKLDRPAFLPESCKLFNNWQDLYRDTSLDGVIVAGPHRPYFIIRDMLYDGKKVMAEKPVTTNIIECEDGLEFHAKKNNLLVNYIHLYSDPFQELKKIINGKKITRIYSSGYGPSPKRDFSSLWDYGCHDLSMILSLVTENPKNIHITQQNKTKSGDLFNINLSFTGFTTKSIVGNGSVQKSRCFCVYYEDEGKIKQVMYDDLLKNKLCIDGTPVGYKSTGEPLENSIKAFIRMIDGNEDTRYGMDMTTKITKILSTWEE